MHSIVFLMNSWFPQKQSGSALSLQPDMYNQVFKQRGSKPGQLGVGYDAGALELEVETSGLDGEP